MALPDMLIPQPNETADQAGRRRVVNEMLRQQADNPTMPNAMAQQPLGTIGSPFGRLGSGIPGRAMQPAPDPHSAMLANGQRSIDAQRQTLAASQPQNLGQGIAMAGDAFNLAMRQRAQQQAAADPWAGMRQTTTGAAGGGGFDLGSALKRILG